MSSLQKRDLTHFWLVQFHYKDGIYNLKIIQL